MTDKQQPDALRLADELEHEKWHVPAVVMQAAAEELRRQHAELETLRTGYAAARLEIESLRAYGEACWKAGYKHGAWADAQPAGAQQPGAAYTTQDSEHQLAIMEGERNASLDAYSRVVSITSAESRLYERAFTSGWDRRDRLASYGKEQPGAAYTTLPEPITYQIAVLKACEHGDALVGWRVEPSRQSFDASMRPKRKLYTEGDMHDFADRTHALRASHGQAPAGEPYCWHYWSIAGASAFHLVRSNRLDADIAASKQHPEAHHVVPLYAAPQPTMPQPAPQPSPSAQAASSAVLKAIREANMQLVRTGDDAFMLVPYKVATAQPAPAAVVGPADTFRGDTTCLVQNIIALLELDADGALVPHGIGGHARALLSAAASRLAAAPTTQPAPQQEDAARLDWLLWMLPGDAIRYVVGELADTADAAEFRAAIDAARKEKS